MTEKKMDLATGGKVMNIKDLDAEIAKIATGTEVSLFHVEKQVEYDGIVMEK